jgi:hypothetical protein
LATRTSSQNGNWSATATWGGDAPPGSGDIAVIAHAVTITADTVVGTGADETVLSVATSATGASLTVTGAKLTIKGNATIGGAYMGGTLGTRLTVQPNGTTPGGIEFDGNTGVSPVVSVNVDVLLRFLGTASAHCFVRTKSGTAGGNGRLVNSDSNRSFFVEATYTDFNDLGDATYAGLKAPYVTWAVDPANPPFTFDHCTIDGCGRFPEVQLDQSGQNSVDCQFTNCTWQNGVGDYLFVISVANSHALTAGGNRLIDRCVMTGSPFQISNGTGFTITNCYYDDVPIINRDYNWASYDGNFWNSTGDNTVNGTRPGFAGDVTNSFVFMNPPSASSPGASFISGYYDSSISDNVFEYTGSATGTLALFISDNPGRDVTTTVKRNLAIGAAGMQLVDFMDPSANSPYRAYQIVEHNTQMLGGNYGSPVGRTESRAGSITSFRSNLMYRTGTATTQYGLRHAGGTVANDAVTNSGGNSSADYNGWTGLAATPGGTYSAPNDKGNGTIYHLPLSVTPGAHDVNADPEFFAPSRNLAAWDAYKGGSGTIAGAIARIQADPTLTKTDLIPWVRAGFAPTNVAYDGTAHDGGDIGAVDWESGAASTYTFDGPSSGTVNVESTDFTVTPDGPWTGTITPDSTGLGTFTPEFLTWSGSSDAKTFTYTPTSTAGSPHTISVTADPALGTDPTSKNYTVNEYVAVATAYAWDGPTAGITGAASAEFEVVLNGVYTGTITPDDGGDGGTFTPDKLTWNGTSEKKTFTYTAATDGAKTIGVTADPAIGADPPDRLYTASENGPTAPAIRWFTPSPRALASRRLWKGFRR